MNYMELEWAFYFWSGFIMGIMGFLFLTLILIFIKK